MRTSALRNFTYDTVDAVARASTLPQVGVVLADAMAKLGFSAFGIAGLPPQEGGADLVIVTEKMPDGFRDLYIAERFYLVDHIAAHARITAEAFRFSGAPFKRALSRPHERFLQALRSNGVSEGLIVPTGHPGTPACVWMAGECPDLADDAIQMIQLVALYAAGKAHTLARRRGAGEPPVLTLREREVLAWAAQGKSAWETGMILRIAKRTVEQHTRSAMRKLAAANKTQAVVRALLANMLEI
jgi:LuxR family quorum sensing-dependent transcriptional regulator